MTTEAFLARLREALGDLAPADREDALTYFEEMILDKAADQGIPQEDVIASLGDIASIAAEIRASAARPQQPNTPPAGEDGENGPIVFAAAAARVRSLYIRTANCSVAVRPGSADQVKIHYTQSERVRYDISLEQSELRMVQEIRPRFTFPGLGMLFEPRQEITVLLPREYAGKADIATSNAAVTLEGISLWGTLQLQTANAHIQLKHASAKDADIRTSNARIGAEQVSAQQALRLTTSNGHVEADALTGAELHLRTSNGALRVHHVKADHIALTTSNGSITGTVAGRAEEYSVTSSTSNGHNALRGHAFAGGKQLSVRTSNGSIRLAFEGDGENP